MAKEGGVTLDWWRGSGNLGREGLGQVDLGPDL
jgi:hypothetical protein